MRHGRRQRGLGDLPWVTIAAIVGVIAVAGIALFFFMGSGSGSAPGSSSGGSSAPSSTAALTNTGVSKIVVKETTQPAIPSTGTYVQVTYLGSFSGSYGPTGAPTKIRDSGTRVYTIDNPNGTAVIAKFQKQDSSSKHDLNVQIWKDGKAVKYGTNSSAYGLVSLQYP